MTWKDYLKILIAAFLPTLFGLVAGLNPPFDQAQFGEIIMWLLTLILGGGAATTVGYRTHRTMSKR